MNIHVRYFYIIIQIVKVLSCIPDQDFGCFYQCEKFYLTYPVPIRGKDKKRTAEHLIPEIIVMLKLCHHVTSQRIQDFLEAFFKFNGSNSDGSFTLAG